ncbi:phosphopantetheine-binding protein [Streptomyces sp. NPDC101152]|uniref:phosphopantetheine-binding protein n=1 Tax=Streptomyces sp. NPDC101152 TaxID=3366116 RepID=UPI0037F47B2B
MTQEVGQDVQPVLHERLVTLLTSHLDVKAEPEQLTAETTFESLGMDSLSLMELVVAAEEEFGIVLPEEAVELSPAATLGEAARMFDHAR